MCFALLFCAFVFVFSDISAPERLLVIDAEEAKNVDVHLFSSRFRGMSSLYFMMEDGTLSDYTDFLHN